MAGPPREEPDASLADRSRRPCSSPRRTPDDLAAWRPVYNSICPHEALGDEPPVLRWRPSDRRRPDQVPEPDYPPGSIVRRFGQVGDVRCRGARILVGRGLAGEPVRLEERDGLVEISYCRHRNRSLCIRELRRDMML